ncbi:hypothetical protein F5Y18DRAFT_402970, partial [Xylariaceae sp. FL1019]
MRPVFLTASLFPLINHTPGNVACLPSVFEQNYSGSLLALMSLIHRLRCDHYPLPLMWYVAAAVCLTISLTNGMVNCSRSSCTYLYHLPRLSFMSN